MAPQRMERKWWRQFRRGIPYMMSASGKHIRGVINTPKLSNNSKYISWSEGGEVENPQNCEDVIHGCPLATH